MVVIGAGPAGTVTAAALAQRGMPVLLVDGEAGTLDHDVLVSGQALRGLASLGGSAATAATPIRVIRLSFGRGPGRSITDAGAVVCGRSRLRDRLRLIASAAGAVQIQGHVSSCTRVGPGYEVLIAQADGTLAAVTARHVVAATGSALGPAPASPACGIACARRFTGVALRRRVVLTMTAPAAGDAAAPPVCVWALPGDGGSLTVTAASSGEGATADATNLLDLAVETLALADGRFAAIRPAGLIVSGPLDAGYSPERMAAAEHLLVGDAAGLVNPFTGEGLSDAVHSGLLAARSIAQHPSDPDAARQAYARRLSASFVGFFETARHAGRRYHLTWRVLAASARSDHPFFAKARRVTLLPEGLAGLAPADDLGLRPQETIMLAPFLMACDEVAIMMIRTQWPFLARLMAAADDAAGPGLRPAVLFFAGLLADDRKPDVSRATLAAGIELAHLGALSFLGPPVGTRAPRRGVDWPATTTILAGDFLLAQASRLVAESAPEVSWSFADWLAELTALRSGRLDPGGARVPAGGLFASLLEFPARTGAVLGRCPAQTVQAVREVGYQCGTAFLHAEDVLALRGERTRLDITLQAMLAGRISSIPECLHRWDVTVRDLADPQLRADALTASAQACLAARRRALDAVAAVPGPVAARILRRFVGAVTRPARSPGHRSGGQR